MNEEMMTTGFTGGDASTGPTAGYDPVIKFRKKIEKKRKIKEEIDRHNHTPSRLFQYKVSMPTVGETILYANSPAELMQKLRLLINPRFAADISIERIMPVAAGNFYMNKRAKHIRNLE